MTAARRKHIVLVEAYDGVLEFLTEEPLRRSGARCLGLPIREIAAELDCRITILCWDAWLLYETNPGSFLNWSAPPISRPIVAPGPGPMPPAEMVGDLEIRQIPARDPEHRLDFALCGCSPLTLGLLADSDPLFTLSYCLERHLVELLEDDPFDLAIIPMWGGLGFVAQLARAIRCNPLAHVPFAAVVTDISAHRQLANCEGYWTRPALTRRQMEDMSLALADLVLVFGDRSRQIALDRRLPDTPPPVLATRFVPESLLDGVAAAAERSIERPVAFFMHGPKQASSGCLVALDAVALLRRRGIRLDRPLVCSGPDMIFAPMAPRRFVDYWSARGFVRELVTEQRWIWRTEPAASIDRLPVRLYPSLFDHLPDIWQELSSGSMAVLSEAAADGFAPGEQLPRLATIPGECTPEGLADTMELIASVDADQVDRERRALCRAVLKSQRGKVRDERFAAMIGSLAELLSVVPQAQDLSGAALMLLDRRRPLAQVVAGILPRPSAPRSMTGRAGTLTVVVVCYNLGTLLDETLESIWSSTRRPDEVLLIDDGSNDAATLLAITRVEEASARRRLPLRVIRQLNAGLAQARNTGLSAASGEFISFLDGDDLIGPEFYALALDVLRRYPRLGGVAAWAEIFGEGVDRGFWNAPQPEFPLILIENTVFVPCMVRTDVLRAIGGYDVKQRYNYEDWELSIRLLSTGNPIITAPRYLQRYRVRPDSLLRTMTAVQNQDMRERLLDKHRPVVERFSVEAAMLLENRLMKFVYAREVTPSGSRRKDVPVWLRRGLGRAWRRAVAFFAMTGRHREPDGP